MNIKKLLALFIIGLQLPVFIKAQDDQITFEQNHEEIPFELFVRKTVEDYAHLDQAFNALISENLIDQSFSQFLSANLAQDDEQEANFGEVIGQAEDLTFELFIKKTAKDYPHLNHAFNFLMSKNFIDQSFSQFLSANLAQDITQEANFGEVICQAEDVITHQMKEKFISSLNNWKSNDPKLPEDPIFLYVMNHKNTSIQPMVRQWLREWNNITREHGNTALHLAAYWRKPTIIALLIDAGVDVNSQNKHNATALHLAASSNCNIVQQLIDAGADVNIQNIELETPLIMAAYKDNSGVVDLLIKNGAHVDHQNRSGNTALHRAIEDNSIRTIKVLMNAGANVDLPNQEGKTPLDKATYDSPKKIIKIVLARVTDVHHEDKYKQTALCAAACYNLKGFVIKFINAGADINVQDSSGNTPLHVTNNTKIAELLIEHGADVNLQNNSGETPLHRTNNHRSDTIRISNSITKLLIKNGANLNIQDDYGYTPLHRAASCKNYSTAKILLKYGALVNMKNNRGCTPMELTDADNQNMQELLIKHRAHINIFDDTIFAPKDIKN